MKKILAVDDNPDILEPLALLLEDEGYEVKISTKPDQTYQLIDQFQPDLVLLDILMSGIDGRDICRALKKNDKTKSVPIVMMSAHPSAKKSMESYNADAFLPKPFEISELLQVVEKHIS